jgi:hypothetical protein
VPLRSREAKRAEGRSLFIDLFETKFEF